MRRFDRHSIDLARREGWRRARVGTPGPTGPRADWDDRTLLCADLDDIVELTQALVEVPSLKRIEFGLFGLPQREMIACVERLSSVPELLVRFVGLEQLPAVSALGDAVAMEMWLGRSDRQAWNVALDDVLPSLGRLRSLCRLQVAGGAVDGRSLTTLGGLRELELNSVTLTHAAALRGLQLQRVAGWSLSEPATLLGELAVMGSLTELSLTRCGLTDDALPLVARSSRLKILRLPSNEIGGAGLSALDDLPLEVLELSQNPVEALDCLPALPCLRALEMQGVDLREQRCGVLAGMQRLEKLDLCRSRVGQRVGPWIGRMRSIKVLQLAECELVNASFVSDLRQLQVLDLTDNRELERLVASDVRPLANLQQLNLGSNSRVGVGLMSAVSELPHLAALDLTICNLVPDHLSALARSTSLRRLTVSWNDLGDAGMRALAPLSDLAYLGVGSCRVGDVGAAALADQFGALRYLDVHGNHLSDVGAAAVMGLGRLLWLDVSSNHIRRTDLALSGARLSVKGQEACVRTHVPEPCFLIPIDQQLEAAFDGVPVPEPPSHTLYQAEAADSYESCDRSRDHLGRWQELPNAHLADCRCALSYLDAHGFRYYLPAMIRAKLHNRLEPSGRYDHVDSGLEFHLTPRSSTTDPRFERERFALLDVRQRAAIAAWVHATQDDAELRAAWGRVVRHDATDGGGDWFDAFWSPSAET